MAEVNAAEIGAQAARLALEHVAQIFKPLQAEADEAGARLDGMLHSVVCCAAILEAYLRSLVPEDRRHHLRAALDQASALLGDKFKNFLDKGKKGDILN